MAAAAAAHLAPHTAAAAITIQNTAAPLPLNTSLPRSNYQQMDLT